MKTAFVLTTLLAGASAFGVVAPQTTRSSTAGLFAGIPAADRSADQMEISEISEKWSKIRFMDRAEAEKLEPEWLEAYNRFHERYATDMENMADIAVKVKKLIEPPVVAKKTKGQRKRDAWAVKVERAAIRAAAKN